MPVVKMRDDYSGEALRALRQNCAMAPRPDG